MHSVSVRKRFVKTAVVAAVLGASTAFAAPSFVVSETGFGSGPEDVALGQLNADSIPDLAVTNADGASVTIFYGATGGFSSASTRVVSSSALNSPQGIALEDFNNDGRTDMAVSNYNARSVSVFLRNTDGSFGAPTTTTVERNPLGIAAARLRGPSAAVDLVVATKTNRDGYVTVLLGNNNGTFQAPTNFAGLDHGRRLVVGDFGSATSGVADGNLDVAATAQGAIQGVRVFFGNGLGGFSATTKTYSAGSAPSGITSADFNGDSCPDLATANAGTLGLVKLLLGTCAGTESFGNSQTIASFTSNANTFGITTVDLNGGLPDLAVTNTGKTGTTYDRVALVLNNTPIGGAPSFSFTECAVGDAPKGVASGSFNTSGDSFADIAVANRNSNNVMILNGDGTGTSCATPSVLGNAEPLKGPVSLTACDVTRPGTGAGAPDNATDLLVLDRDAKQVATFVNDGFGNFARKAYSTADISALSNKAIDVRCANVDGDTDNDILVTNDQSGTTNDRTIVCINDGNGAFTCSTLASGNGPADAVAGDFGPATLPDYCVANADAGQINCSNDGAHTAGVALTRLTVGDINNYPSATGLDVVASANGSHPDEVFLLLNNYLGNFGSFPPTAASFDLGSNKAAWVTNSDIDGDGKNDIVTANPDSGNVALLLGNGNGTFANYVTFAAGQSPNSVAGADFECQGVIDLAAADDRRDKVAILEGTGSDTPPSSILSNCAPGTTACEFDAGDGPVSIVVAQLNLIDNRPDIAVLNADSGTLSILLNTSPGCGCTCPPCPE